MRNYQIIKSLKKYTCFCCLLFATCFYSCKKDVTPVLPGNSPAIGLNFYPASDVMAAYLKTFQFTAIYVDHYNPTLPTGINSGIPVFSLIGNGTISESPNLDGNVFTYTPYKSGGHRLMFTDTTNTVVLDTTINFQPNSYSSVYFTDAMTAVNAPAAYKAIAVTESKSAVPVDKVGVRFVHASADAGTLVCSRVKADGSLTNGLPDDLHFGEASAYEYFSANDAASGLIRFSLDNPTNGASVATGVPFDPGKSYVIVISGFFNDQQRQINAGKNQDGSRKYQSINISRNLHAALRRSN